MKANDKYMPQVVASLGRNEIFVFGSNRLGNHIGGAAKVAFQEFGAQWGVGEGLTGQTYALPTLDEYHLRVTMDELYESFVKFLKCVASHQNNMFLLTPVGCGIAGFDTNQVADVFWRAVKNNFPEPAFELRRIVLPETFVRSKREHELCDIWYDYRQVVFHTDNDDSAQHYQDIKRDVENTWSCERE